MSWFRSTLVASKCAATAGGETAVDAARDDLTDLAVREHIFGYLVTTELDGESPYESDENVDLLSSIESALDHADLIERLPSILQDIMVGTRYRGQSLLTVRRRRPCPAVIAG